MAGEPAIDRIPIRDLVRYYLRLGVLGFGGPVALVGQMERERCRHRARLPRSLSCSPWRRWQHGRLCAVVIGSCLDTVI